MTEIVDIDVDPLTERTRRRRTLLRIGLPLGGVGLIVGVLLGIEVYTDAANRVGVLSLSDTLLSALQQRIALEVSLYLVPAERAILLAQAQFGHGGATRRPDEARAFAASILAHTPQVDDMLFADSKGNFQLVTRAGDDTPGGIAAKTIRIGPDGRRVQWTTWDRGGALISQHDDPTDTFDARTRPWFLGPHATSEVFWTQVYTFFTEDAPGVTAALRTPGEDPDVIGMDIRLDDLSRFLGGLSIGRTGRAYIVDETGTLVAGPDPSRIMLTRSNERVPASIAELGDPDLAATWDHYRIEGAGSRLIEVNGRSLISIATPLAAASHWLLMITAPEAEFSGFIAVNGRRSAEWSLSVLVLALGLAVLLVRQGLRTDRADRAVADRAAALRDQAAAMARLSVEACQADGSGSLPAGLTEAVAEATAARRVSIWRFPEGARALHCEDSFEPRTRGHVSGLEIATQEVPQLLAAVGRGEEIETADARRDRRCAPLLSALLTTPGAVRLLVVPLLRDGTARGLLLLEDPRMDAATRDLARAGAALLALRAPERAAAGTALPVAQTLVPPEHMMRPAGLAATTLVAEPAPCPDGTMRAALMVLRLSRDVLDERAAPGAGGELRAQRLLRMIEEAAANHGLTYARVLGGTVIAAAGLAQQSDAALTDGASRLAGAALTVRDECLTLLAHTDEPPAFRLGLDVGAIHVQRVGDSPVAQNVWGEALRGAEVLADTAPAGSIQASEHIYRRLRAHFVFRPRGVFHLPGVGDADCYVLAGRA